MGQYKWLLGMLGLFIGRTPGAIIGVIIGAIIDYLQKAEPENKKENENRVDDDVIILAAALLKTKPAIGNIELEYLKRFLARFYGTIRIPECTEKLHYYFEKKIDINYFAQSMAENYSYRARMRIFEFYFGLAASDAEVSGQEEKILIHIAKGLGLSHVHYDNIRSTYFNRFKQSENKSRFPVNPQRINDFYTTLGISANVGDAEVKKAFRTMVLKYHPDRNVFENERQKKEATEKFHHVTQAYERIKEHRGIK